jgi:serine/threonine protein kinase
LSVVSTKKIHNKSMREQHGFAKEQPDSQAVSSVSPISGAKLHTSISSALQRFGNYDLVQRIGVGGMGEVYLARQRTAFGREVAVKIIRSDLMHDITIRKRFLREAEVNAYLKHDHILPLVEFGEEQGRLFLVTPYIKGGTLLKRLKGGALTLAETQELFSALVHAVAYLHKRGVIHRDLKPSNIMLDHEEGSERVYVRLIDFGIAALQGLTASAPLTMAGHEMGTEAYMAPERLSGIAAPSNDIYSLGIILYQMLTGKLPEDEGDVMLPEPLIEVVQQSTIPDPAQRYASAEVLLKAFEHAYKSLSLSHFRVTSSNPDLPAVGRNNSASSSPPRPLTPAQPQTPPSAPVTPIPNEPPRRSPLPPSTNIPARAAPDTPSLPPRVRRFNSMNAQHSSTHVDGETVHSRNRKGASPFPTSSDPELQNQDAAQPASRFSQSYTPARLRAEVILPPLPDKTGPFKGEDYEAPTSDIASEPVQKRSAVSVPDRPSRPAQNEKATPPKEKKRSVPVVTIVSAMIIIIVFVIGTIGYSIYQSYLPVNTATITITPQQEALSTTFNLTAKLNPTKDDSKAGIIPLQVLNSTQSESKPGNTTGIDIFNCNVTALNCKHIVSQDDVSRLARELRSTVQEKIKNDIGQQEQGQGVTPFGDIVFGNESVTSKPLVGATSETVTVTLSLKGRQDCIKTSDVRTIAKQKLQQLKPNDTLVDSTMQVSPPVMQGSDAQGNVQIVVAVGAVGRTKISDNDISNMKKSIAGKSQDEARAIIAQNLNLDPKNIPIKIDNGTKVPGDVGHITINVANPSTTPSVQLTPIPQ